MNFFRRKRFESAMDEELRFHKEAYVADLIRDGMDPQEAWRRASIEFGSVEATKEECRQAWGLQYLDELRTDFRLTFRSLRRNPGFAAVAIFSLALGIGANTAIFSIVDTVMLRSLPVLDPNQLHFIYSAGATGRDGPPYPYFELLRSHTRQFTGLAAFSPSGIEMTSDRGREQLRGLWVSGNFYELLGVAPLKGRTLSSADEEADEASVVISDRFWRTRFGADPSILGRSIQIFQRHATIVGIMPSEIMSLEPGSPVDLALPMAFSSPEKMKDRAALWLFVVGRLKPHANLEAARAEADTLFQGYAADLPISAQVRQMLYQRIELAPAGQGLNGLRQQFAKPLTVLAILALLVLLACCVNLISLLLARATARQRDSALRLAIGASKGRLLRHTLTEAIVLSAAGSLLGILLAFAGQAALLSFFAENNREIVLDFSPNLRLLLFSSLIGIFVVLFLSILPALRAARLDPSQGLQGSGRSIAGDRISLRLGRALVVVQVALSIVLLTGSGLFIKSLRGLESVDIGFPREGLLTLEAAPERQIFGTSEWLGVQSEILERVRHIPGLRSASWATMNPLSGRDRGAMIEAQGFLPRSEKDKEIHLAAVSPEYFDTLGIGLQRGRVFTPRDTGNSPKVAILNETAARFYFANENPLGRKVRFTNYPSSDLVYEVVGLVKDAKHDELRQPAQRFIYLPITQSVDRINRLALAARVSGPPATFIEPIRREISRARATILITNVSTMEKQIERLLIQERLLAALSATFGAVAVLLACIGLYGILAYSVTRRSGEIGLRLALGADRRNVAWLILREALLLAACGIALGLPLAFSVGHAAKATLYGTGAADPVVISIAVLLLITLATIAAILPTLRATRLDPIATLRTE